MRFLDFVKFFHRANPLLMVGTMHVLNQFYKAAFLSTAAEEGILRLLSTGPKSGKEIHDSIGMKNVETELQVWLDLGVSLGVLCQSQEGYALKGTLAKGFSKPENDAMLAYLQARVKVIFDYVINTPKFLQQGRRFIHDDSVGELFARSSRTVEPLLLDIVDRIVPQMGHCQILEVGCGSGSYIHRACQRNPNAEVTGLEVSEKAADFARRNLYEWNLESRARVETIDVRDYHNESGFDLVTFHNLIYYFPKDERIELLRHLQSLVKPNGQFVLTTLCDSRDPATCTMNLWSTMTEGCGPLPQSDDLERQLKEAGFRHVKQEQVISNYYLFIIRS